MNIVEGKMQYLFDENGRRYVDAFGGIATVNCGHCHPDVADAIVKQINRLQHSTVLYLNHAIADFAEALASKMPGDLKVSVSDVGYWFEVLNQQKRLMGGVCVFCRWCFSLIQARKQMSWR